jgi:hypothetical protein
MHLFFYSGSEIFRRENWHWDQTKNVISSKFYQTVQGIKYMEYIYGTDNQYNVKKKIITL